MRHVLPICLLAGCATIDLYNLSTFRPDATNEGFQFQTIADRLYPIDSDRAEALRIVELEKRLSVNGFCPEGYDIVNRRAVLKGQFSDKIFDVFYTGRCR